jgi:hypothetical protein
MVGRPGGVATAEHTSALALSARRGEAKRGEAKRGEVRRTELLPFCCAQAARQRADRAAFGVTPDSVRRWRTVPLAAGLTKEPLQCR